MNRTFSLCQLKLAYKKSVLPTLHIRGHDLTIRTHRLGRCVKQRGVDWLPMGGNLLYNSLDIRKVLHSQTQGVAFPEPAKESKIELSETLMDCGLWG